jgi:hypothetical protein
MTEIFNILPKHTYTYLPSIEWTTVPKQRTNQWSCFLVGSPLDWTHPTRGVLALIALYLERVEANNPEFMMAVGDNRKFNDYQRRKSRYANNIRSKKKEEQGDSDDDINSVKGSKVT